MKKAGFPPLAWYDALLELSRAPSGEMRPVELEKQMLIPQYSTSRLIDRLVDEGLAARRECKIDKRGQFVEITEAGRELQKKMWNAYSAAIEKYVGSKLSDADAIKLCGLLDRLGCSCGEVKTAAAAETACPRDDTLRPFRMLRTTLSADSPWPHGAFGRIAPTSGFSMARDQIDMTPLQSRDELVAWLEAGVKPPSEFRIGTEHEKTPFTLEGHQPVPYEGARGIGALLEGMQLLLGWEPIMERGNIIGLYDVTGGGAISLEPGGQFELSGAPVETVHQTQSELMAHLAQVREIATPLGIGFLGLGMTPSWSRAQIPVMPKGRYKIMTNYMPKVGQYGLDMMYRTCTVQTNLDFSSEADMVKKLAGVGGAAAGRDRAVRQFAVHRRQAQRLPVVPLRDLARHRQCALRHDSLGVRGRHGVRALGRLRARRADVFRQARRRLYRRRRARRSAPSSTARTRHSRASVRRCRTGPIICRRFFRKCG